jgi:hypothetical protein
MDGRGLPTGELLNSDAAFITEFRGRQSVVVYGEFMKSTESIDPETNDIYTAPYDAVGSYRKKLDYMLSGNNTLVRVDADMLLESRRPKTDNDAFGFTITLRDGDGVALGEIGLFSNKSAQAYPITKRVGEVTPPIFTKPISFNNWYHVSMLLDTVNDTTAYFIDEHFIGAIHAPSTSNKLDRGAIVVYALPDAGGFARTDYNAHLDNFRISVHNAKTAPDIN